MTRVTNIVIRVIEMALVLLMSFMVVLVFINVVLRYGFNSGLHLSDELSRYAFVWLTFLGAIPTLRDNMHVNIETLIAHFPRRGRVLCMGATQVIILMCAIAMIWGTLRLHPLNATMHATVSGIPMNWVSDILVVGGIGFFIIAFARLLRLLTGRVSDAEIAAFAGQFQVEEKQ